MCDRASFRFIIAISDSGDKVCNSKLESTKFDDKTLSTRIRLRLTPTGTPELGGGAGGAAAPVALYQEGQGGAKVPFQFKGLP